MNDDDAAMFDAYNKTMEFAHDIIRSMGGDPAKPTHDQATAAAKAILDLAVAHGVGPMTSEQILADYDEIQRIKKRHRH